MHGHACMCVQTYRECEQLLFALDGDCSVMRCYRGLGDAAPGLACGPVLWYRLWGLNSCYFSIDLTSFFQERKSEALQNL